MWVGIPSNEHDPSFVSLGNIFVAFPPPFGHLLMGSDTDNLSYLDLKGRPLTWAKIPPYSRAGSVTHYFAREFELFFVRAASNVIDVYNYSTRVYREVEQPGLAKSSPYDCFTIEGKGYISKTDSLQIYDLDTNTVTLGSPKPANKRGFHPNLVDVENGKAYEIGRSAIVGGSTDGYEYTEETDTWFVFSGPPVGSGHGYPEYGITCPRPKEIYQVGDHSITGHQKPTYKLSMETYTWEHVATTGWVTSANTFRLLSYEGTMYKLPSSEIASGGGRLFYWGNLVRSDARCEPEAATFAPWDTPVVSIEITASEEVVNTRYAIATDLKSVDIWTEFDPSQFLVLPGLTAVPRFLFIEVEIEGGTKSITPLGPFNVVPTEPALSQSSIGLGLFYDPQGTSAVSPDNPDLAESFLVLASNSHARKLYVKATEPGYYEGVRVSTNDIMGFSVLVEYAHDVGGIPGDWYDYIKLPDGTYETGVPIWRRIIFQDDRSSPEREIAHIVSYNE